MRVEHPVDETTRADTLKRLRDPATWTAWMPALKEAIPHEGSVRLRFGGPRPFSCAVQLAELEEGLSFTMEEGEIRSLEGQIRLERDAVVAELDLQFGVNVPGTLWTSLERDAMPAALRRLTRPDVPGGNGPHAD